MFLLRPPKQDELIRKTQDHDSDFAQCIECGVNLIPNVFECCPACGGQHFKYYSQKQAFVVA